MSSPVVMIPFPTRLTTRFWGWKKTEPAEVLAVVNFPRKVPRTGRTCLKTSRKERGRDWSPGVWWIARYWKRAGRNLSKSRFTIMYRAPEEEYSWESQAQGQETGHGRTQAGLRSPTSGRSPRKRLSEKFKEFIARWQKSYPVLKRYCHDRYRFYFTYFKYEREIRGMIFTPQTGSKGWTGITRGSSTWGAPCQTPKPLFS